MSIEQLAIEKGAIKTTQNVFIEESSYVMSVSQLEAFAKAYVKQQGEAALINKPVYDEKIMGFNVGLVDRYDAMKYGWDKAIEAIYSQSNNDKLYTNPPSSQARIEQLEVQLSLYMDSNKNWMNDFKSMQATNKTLLDALKDLFADYKALADSSDAVFWELEETEIGKRTLQAIAEAEGYALVPIKPDSKYLTDVALAIGKLLESVGINTFDINEWCGTYNIAKTAHKAMLSAYKPQADEAYGQDFNLEYTCKRIRRLLNAMSMSDPSNGKDHVLMGMLFTLLGTICSKLEKPQADDVRKDAERYRFLREGKYIHNGEPFIARNFGASFSQWTGEVADKVIDQAIDKARE